MPQTASRINCKSKVSCQVVTYLAASLVMICAQSRGPGVRDSGAKKKKKKLDTTC